MAGGGVGIGGEPFVERDGEGEEFLAVVQGVDHFDVELGAFEGGLVQVLDVVEEVSGKRCVGVNDGAFEAKVVVVLADFLVDGVVDGDGDEVRLVDGLRYRTLSDAEASAGPGI